MNHSQNSRRVAAKLVSVAISGISVQVNPASIAKKDRTVLHGEYQGKQVNSPAICKIGESVVLWPDAEKPFAAVLGHAELGVLSTKFLEADGYKVTRMTETHIG